MLSTFLYCELSYLVILKRIVFNFLKNLHIYIINHECAARTKFNKFKRVYSIIYRQFNYFSSFQWLKFWITESKIKILNNPNVLWDNADVQRDWVFVTNWNILIFIFNFQMVWTFDDYLILQNHYISKCISFKLKHAIKLHGRIPFLNVTIYNIHISTTSHN